MSHLESSSERTQVINTSSPTRSPTGDPSSSRKPKKVCPTRLRGWSWWSSLFWESCFSSSSFCSSGPSPKKGARRQPSSWSQEEERTSESSFWEKWTRIRSILKNQSKMKSRDNFKKSWDWKERERRGKDKDNLNLRSKRRWWKSVLCTWWETERKLEREKRSWTTLEML